eukprot:2636015-Rhodomonas_salina.4
MSALDTVKKMHEWVGIGTSRQRQQIQACAKDLFAVGGQNDTTNLPFVFQLLQFGGQLQHEIGVKRVRRLPVHLHHLAATQPLSLLDVHTDSIGTQFVVCRVVCRVGLPQSSSHRLSPRSPAKPADAMIQRPCSRNEHALSYTTSDTVRWRHPTLRIHTTGTVSGTDETQQTHGRIEQAKSELKNTPLATQKSAHASPARHARRPWHGNSAPWWRMLGRRTSALRTWLGAFGDQSFRAVLSQDLTSEARSSGEGTMHRGVEEIGAEARVSTFVNQSL